MTKPLLIFVGRVTKLANVNPSKGKPYLSIKIEGIPETYNGKPYSARVEAKVYYGAEELAKVLREGMLVSCHGNAKAEHFEWNQKHYASLICERATVMVLEQGEMGSEAVEKPRSKVELPPAVQKAFDDEESQVPF